MLLQNYDPSPGEWTRVFEPIFSSDLIDICEYEKSIADMGQLHQRPCVEVAYDPLVPEVAKLFYPGTASAGTAEGPSVAPGSVEAGTRGPRQEDLSGTPSSARPDECGPCLADLCVSPKTDATKPEEEAERGVVLVEVARGGVHAAKKKMLLNCDGTHLVEAVEPNDDLDLFQHRWWLAERLQQLKYIESIDDPLIPAIAKLFFVNGLGACTVYPDELGLREAYSLFQTCSPDSLRPNPGSLAFVLPEVTSTTGGRRQLQEFGNRKCAKTVGGGGPFLLATHFRMVDEFLMRLGFLDSHLNQNFSEAVDVFCRGTRNFRSLRLLGVSIPQYLDEISKRALLHTALMTTKSPGKWNTAPSCASIRNHLAAKGYLRNECVPPEAVYAALAKYSELHGLPWFKNYNSLLQSVQGFVAHREPSARRM